MNMDKKDFLIVSSIIVVLTIIACTIYYLDNKDQIKLKWRLLSEKVMIKK